MEASADWSCVHGASRAAARTCAVSECSSFIICITATVQTWRFTSADGRRTWRATATFQWDFARRRSTTCFLLCAGLALYLSRPLPYLEAEAALYLRQLGELCGV